MKNNNLKWIVRNAIIAALYAALTIALAPISYGGIQFRFAELLVLLALYNPRYGFGLVLGCFVANCFSDFGVIDMVFGTMATLIAILPMLKVKNKYIASLFPVLSNAIIVGLELYFMIGLPFWIGALQVALGEFVCVSIIGIAVFNAIEKNEALVETMELVVPTQKENFITKYFDFYKSMTLALSVVIFCLYFALPMWTETVFAGTDDQYSINYSPFVLSFGVTDENAVTTYASSIYNIILLLIPCILWIAFNYLPKLAKIVGSSLLILGFIITWILLGIKYTESFGHFSYYGYLIPILMYGVILLFYIKKAIKEEAIV